MLAPEPRRDRNVRSGECSTEMRWTAKRKAQIVVAVRAGRVTAEDMERQHGISAEELAAWVRDYDAHGLAGLLTTKLHRCHHERDE